MRSRLVQVTMLRTFRAVGGRLSLLALGLVGVATAQEGHDHAAGTHGGAVAQTRRHQFEVVFRKDGLGVYPMGQDGTPLDPSRLTGTAMFALPGAPRPFAYRLQAAPSAPGH